MKILHTIASMASQSGGTTTCTRELVQALNDSGCATDILTVEDRAGSSPEEENAFIHAVPNDLRTPLGISMNLRRRLGAWRDCDLYHTNGLWLDVNHATCAEARKTCKPCVVSPHGMLYPQALAIKPWRKNSCWRWATAGTWRRRTAFTPPAGRKRGTCANWVFQSRGGHPQSGGRAFMD